MSRIPIDLSGVGLCPGAFSLDDVSKDKTKNVDLFEEKKFKGWKAKNTLEARCDFKECLKITKSANGIRFISVWRKSVFGYTLSEIKQSENMVPKFVKAMSDIISAVLGQFLSPVQWAIVVPPKRRHKDWNFATEIAKGIADELGIAFVDDCAVCHSRKRVNAVFDIENLPEQPNIIVFDDFVTTGSTLASMKNLLIKFGKNLVFFAGISNR